jgi:hypothetical protein
MLGDGFRQNGESHLLQESLHRRLQVLVKRILYDRADATTDEVARSASSDDHVVQRIVMRETRRMVFPGYGMNQAA